LRCIKIDKNLVNVRNVDQSAMTQTWMVFNLKEQSTATTRIDGENVTR